MSPHYHPSTGALPITILDEEPERTDRPLHVHTYYLGNDRYWVLCHTHDGYEMASTLVPEHLLLDHLTWAHAESQS